MGFIFVKRILYELYDICNSIYLYHFSMGFSPSDTYEIGGSLINITLCMLILYNTYYHANLNRLLYAVMWSGYIVVIYTFLYYGFSYVMLILSIGERMESDFANINNVAMAAAFL